MIGAIAGDIIGSVYEQHPIKTTAFPLFGPTSVFTDDTVLTVAVAWAILNGADYGRAIRRFGREYPHAGYGGSFQTWLVSPDGAPYHSFGNGAAMRVSPVGFAFDSETAVLDQARRSAQVSHDHPEGIKGAQATALAVYLARTGHEKRRIREAVSTRFGYDLDRSLAEIRPGYAFDVSCQGSVPEALIAFLESRDFEDAVRKAVSLGGDSDTLACIAGGVAQAYYREIPSWIVREVEARLPEPLIATCKAFSRRFGLAGF